ncbi:phosphoserine phosphatase [Gemmobacter megaterium]|uniref:Phosphoserine phosphatase n=1 Tax=Gemmobacter megaterium TaxID=1086013 RepID=A0A1N7PEB9_9RHOB|nr:phosphoserine phosphatase SerB [Gemmobacter megaterium]GGE18783.1 phosphoserine phosphatase SerB [Gemmobacter megaterium]SIT08914.1 phosphoserine phosphatase [Gemmobacter megaterium]
MLYAVLISKPDRLDPVLAESLRTAWGGGAPRWLALGQALEFPVIAAPENFRQVWQDLQGMGVDLNLVPAENRRKRMLLADMDSTMIGQECIDELADLAGVGAHVAAITARAMNGELDFEAALKERVALLRGLPEAVIGRVLQERITYTQGGRELIATMHVNGGHAALVSGGFTAFTQAVSAHLGFDEHRANTLLASDGHLTGAVAEPILGRQAKVDALEEISARLGLAATDVLAVGDGANDLGMLHRAGLGVALHAKPSVAAQCEIRVNHGDLTALLFLQGYAVEEFAAA